MKEPLIEHSYYAHYLIQYLRENHPDKVNNHKLISERAERAAELFEQLRRDGKSVDAAQELAMAELLRGLHFSPYTTLVEVLWNEFADLLNPSNAELFALRLLHECGSIIGRYDLADDFALTMEYDELYTELTGFITLKLEQYGV
ncbi:MAG: DUF1896 family protein [Rikenellaceae bacterium]